LREGIASNQAARNNPWENFERARFDQARARQRQMNIPKLILASASPRRSELLRRLGVDFHVVTGQVDEIAGEHLSPHEIVRINAYRKARAVSKKYADYLVIGADTTVCLGHASLASQPIWQTPNECWSNSGRTHEVVTAICLVRLREHRQKVLRRAPVDIPAERRGNPPVSQRD
jgi:predicted house-cleaning NTP pyrophosphatase (Maf/HAM1 superfamily)